MLKSVHLGQPKSNAITMHGVRVHAWGGNKAEVGCMRSGVACPYCHPYFFASLKAT